VVVDELADKLQDLGLALGNILCHGLPFDQFVYAGSLRLHARHVEYLTPSSIYLSKGDNPRLDEAGPLPADFHQSPPTKQKVAFHTDGNTHTQGTRLLGSS
jgi:hypothetical protein